MNIIETLPLGSFQTNCYLVRAEGSTTCAIIDPGAKPEIILRRLAQLQLTPDAILLTHGHFDHVGAVEAIVNETGCALRMSRADDLMKSSLLTTRFYPLTGRSLPTLAFCSEGDRLYAGGVTFTVLDTPGHTPGSVCYRTETELFSGDTLFAGGCGRTDLPGGSARDMLDSLRRLAGLDGDMAVYPGHGSATTLSRERQDNPYLRSREETPWN